MAAQTARAIIQVDHVSVTLTAVGAAPTIVTPPASSGALAGQRVTFSVYAEAGVPGAELTYQWYFNDEAISGAAARQPTITVVASPARAGDYHVVVDDAGLTATSDPATLTLYTRPKATLLPRVQTLDAGAPLTLTASATGTPAPTFQWFLDGEEIPDATSATFSIDAVDALDTGAYKVRVTSAVGSAFSAPASVVVRSGPEIVASPEDIEAAVGATVRLRVVAMAFPKPTYQWRFNGEPIPGAAARAATYAFKAALARAGTYDVVVTNTLGEATSESAIVVVNAAPKIITAPVGAKRRVGQTQVFSVSATGFPTPTYQWLKAGEPIEGETGTTLTLTGLQLPDAGDYAVRITNAGGVVTSRIARLEVSLAPYAVVSNASFRLDGYWSSSVGDSGVVNEAYTFLKDGRIRFEDFVEDEVFGFTLGSFTRTSPNSANLRASTTYQGIKVNMAFVFTFSTPTTGTYTLRGSAPSVGFTANQSGGFTYSEPGL